MTDASGDSTKPAVAGSVPDIEVDFTAVEDSKTAQLDVTADPDAAVKALREKR
ncbi:hypothetical protein [Nocardia concava]|uniref:hypothetical protein n=1 Tax=Nocardia concava TaxID=257281 RepID=UPI0002DBE1CF|nr:hypothetical protein [Nocardia concava]